MAKSVVQFLRGIDLTGVDLSGKDSRAEMEIGGNVDWSREMTRIQWLKLRATNLDHVPSDLGLMQRLEHLTLSKNQLFELSAQLGRLKTLRVINCRRNEITNAGIPAEIFDNPELQVVDFSRNRLTEVPKGIEAAKALLVLNLSENQIENVPAEVFIACTDLMLLDLSDNQLESLPAQLRRLTCLQTLLLNNNPLKHAQLRSVTALKQLETLHLGNTERRVDNFPNELDKLTKLTDLDISENCLPRLPEAVFQIRTLRKLNLSSIGLTDLSGLVDSWPCLETLNLAHNKLTSLPSALCRLGALRKLYINNNELTFNGIPSGIGKLTELEVFNAAENKLENIPEGLCRCGRLKRLILNSNNLLTLPDAIHYLIETLETFEAEDNSQLKMPPKPAELQKGAGLAYYNIDFSLDTQLRLARGKPAINTDSGRQPKDTAARLRRLRIRRTSTTDTGGGSTRVLEGMKRVADEKEALLREREEEEAKQVAHKRWQDALSRPDLDYSKIYDEDVGNIPGVDLWEIDEFYPKRLEEEALFGTFYDGDCYIVLQTRLDSTGCFEWGIYYWIGAKTTLDKKACAAMHAVNLRNLLGAECRTQREEQGDESPEFSALFGARGITVVEGAHGESGFLRVEEKEPKVKLYRLYGDKTVKLISMPVRLDSLDPKYVYLLDAHKMLYVWLGRASRLMGQSKGRLLADKINQRERRGEAEIAIECQGKESERFWRTVCEAIAKEEAAEEDDVTSEGSLSPRPSPRPKPVTIVTSYTPEDHIPLDWNPPKPVLYDVKLGRGFLEMPQVELPYGRLTKSLLDAKHVYIVDCGGEVFVWLGEKSARFLRSAGWRLAHELLELLPRSRARPLPVPCTQNAEPQVFKAHFEGWEETLAVDFTRTADSVQKRGADMKAILERDQMKVDLRALFMPREKPMPWDEAVQLSEEWNEELIGPGDDSDGPPCPPKRLQQFIMVGKKWTLVDPRWVGHFFNKDSYVVIAEYWDYADEEEDEDEKKDDEDGDGDPTKAVVYFWQGREASSLDYPSFTFSIKTGMLDRLADPRNTGKKRPVEVKHMAQQKEDLIFLSHFQRHFIIHTGRYQERLGSERRQRVEMFQLRANGSAITLRCIEIRASVQQLNSSFCFLVKVPGHMMDRPESHGRLYVWIGGKADSNEMEIIEELANKILLEDELDLVTVHEGEEDDTFWTALGGKRRYDVTAEYMQFSRLFRLSNDTGFFLVTEKCSDFCQDDLMDEDVMMLDTGEQIYLWIGKRTSDVEVKLSVQAAKLYKDHLARIQPARPRQLKLTAKKGEAHPFRRCFQGWGPFREPKDWSG